MRHYHAHEAAANQDCPVMASMGQSLFFDGSNNMKTCFKLGSVSLLKRDNKEVFLVVYGLQKSGDLDYAEACKELGQCLMHQLSADGKLDD